MDTNTITVLIAMFASNMGIVGLLFRQTNRLEDKFERLDKKFDAKFDQLDAKIDGVDNRLSAKIDGVDTKLSAKIDQVGVDLADTNRRVARIEGYLLKPGRFTLHGLPGDAGDDTTQPDTEPPSAATG